MTGAAGAARGYAGQPSEWRSGYRVVITGVVGMAAQSAGFMSLGALLPTIVGDTGWSRTEVVGVGAAVAILCLFLSPVVGMMLDRFGGRKMALAGAVLYPAALAGVALVAAAAWQWWLAWLAVGLTIQLINPMVWSFAVGRRFIHRRGLALGVTLSGVGVANAIVPLLIVTLLDHIAWRMIFPVLGLAIFVLLFPLVAFCYRDVPDRGPGSRVGEGRPMIGFMPREAFRASRYWRLSVSVLILAAAVGIINIHLQPILIDAGSSAYGAALIATAFGPAQIAGRLLGGWLLDRIHGTIVGAAMFMAPAISLSLVLAGVTSGTAAYLVPILAGLAAGVEIDVAAYLASRYFGMRCYGTVFSVIYGFHAVGYALAPVLAASVRDGSGGYAPILVAMLCLVPIAALLVGTLGPYPDLAAGTGAVTPR